MDERQKRVYVAELTNSDIGQRIKVCVDLENVAREKTEKIFYEMDTVTEKIKNIMAE